MQLIWKGGDAGACTSNQRSDFISKTINFLRRTTYEKNIMNTCFISNATVFFPGRATIITLRVATVLNPLITSLVAGLGVTLGEGTGFLSDYLGCAFIKKDKDSKCKIFRRLLYRKSFEIISICMYYHANNRPAFIKNVPVMD